MLDKLEVHCCQVARPSCFPAIELGHDTVTVYPLNLAS